MIQKNFTVRTVIFISDEVIIARKFPLSEGAQEKDLTDGKAVRKTK